MCTLSWRYHARRPGYHLFFNRDEQKSREPAEPPRVHSSDDGTRFIAPLDGRAGGTWMLANEHGLTVALLNHYAADTPSTRPERPTSRGQLVLEFAGCANIADFRRQVPARQRAGRYPPFLLFAIDAGGEAALWRWDGTQLRTLPLPGNRFLTTSSYESAAVLDARAEERARHGDDLEALHLQHDTARTPFSVRMRRPDAQTVSRSEVLVSSDTPPDVMFRYTPEPIDSLELMTTAELSLRTGR